MLKLSVICLIVCVLGLTQAYDTLDVGDKSTQKVAEAAIRELDLASNSMYKSKLVKLVKAQLKLKKDGGKQYILVAHIGQSDCRKNDVADVKYCKLTSEVQKCTLKFYVSPILNKQFLSHQCGAFNEGHTDVLKPKHDEKPKHNKNHILGGDDHDVGHYGMFMEFTKKFNKVYSTKKEHLMRFEIFRKNMKKAKKLNETERGTASYGATKFADYTDAEFKKCCVGPVWKIKHDPTMKVAQIPKDTPPAAFDWRNHSAVTPVKNQGSCGSCWAFSTTGNIEGQWAIQKGSLVSLSEQELVDCDKVDEGCNGGLPSNAYKEIERLGGLETEKKYPYEGKDDKCEFHRSDVKVYINGSLNISTNENDMKAWLYKNGPISIGINAMAMQFYMGGISHPWSIFCSPESLDHGVLIVGYGVQKGYLGDTPYWIVKNSWGEGWGEKGYYLVYRGGGVCGLNKMPTSAEVAK